MTKQTVTTPRVALVAAAFGLSLGVCGHAHAMEYLFGFSANDNQETLTLGFAGGGSAVLSTDGHQGWWSATFANMSGNTDYFVGNPDGDSSPESLRNFFTFDISGVGVQTVTGATLSITRASDQSDSGMTSFMYSLYDVFTPAAVLDDTSGTNSGIYDDLGTGVSYGSFKVPLVGASSLPESFQLNANGVAAINAAIDGGAGSFSIGGTLPSPSAVPEPGSVLLLGGALAGLGLTRRRRAA